MAEQKAVLETERAKRFAEMEAEKAQRESLENDRIVERAAHAAEMEILKEELEKKDEDKQKEIDGRFCCFFVNFPHLSKLKDKESFHLPLLRSLVCWIAGVCCCRLAKSSASRHQHMHARLMSACCRFRISAAVL